MKVKSTEYYHISIRIAKTIINNANGGKILRIPNITENAGQQELSFTAA